MIRVLQVLEATEGGTRRHLRDLVGALDTAAFQVQLAVSCGRDPGFRDAANGDLRLVPGSPAVAVGAEALPP